MGRENLPIEVQVPSLGHRLKSAFDGNDPVFLYANENIRKYYGLENICSNVEELISTAKARREMEKKLEYRCRIWDYLYSHGFCQMKFWENIIEFYSADGESDIKPKQVEQFYSYKASDNLSEIYKLGEKDPTVREFIKCLEDRKYNRSH